MGTLIPNFSVKYLVPVAHARTR